MPVLHVVIPFLNEAPTLEAAVNRVLQAPTPTGWGLSIILVDDGSGEKTATIAKEIAAHNENITLVQHDANRGKGAAVKTGFLSAILHAGDEDAVAIQDADLEYNPADLSTLLKYMNEQQADAIIGNRWTAPPRSLKARIHRWGNTVLTQASNSKTGLKLHDMECCYKLIRMPMLRTILPELTEPRFGIEPQIVAVLARNEAVVVEGPVSYSPRGIQEGKKIGVRDAIEAIRVIRREHALTVRTRKNA